jgi:hypothetical protein
VRTARSSSNLGGSCRRSDANASKGKSRCMRTTSALPTCSANPEKAERTARRAQLRWCLKIVFQFHHIWPDYCQTRTDVPISLRPRGAGTARSCEIEYYPALRAGTARPLTAPCTTHPNSSARTRSPSPSICSVNTSRGGTFAVEELTGRQYDPFVLNHALARGLVSAIG